MTTLIQTKDDCIDGTLLQACNGYLASASWKYGWPSNEKMPYGHWNTDISNTAFSNPTDISASLPEPVLAIWNIVNKQAFEGKAALIRCYANRHTFGTEGYIHTDTDRDDDMTCVVYMEKKWNVDWGGETAFYNKDRTEIIKSVVPRYGRFTVFPGTIPHCAKPVSRICPRARTTLMFKVSINPRSLYSSESMLSSFLTEVGANKIPHKRGSLADHLMRTYHLLKSRNAPDDVCLAGGLHSLYGTNAFKTALLPEDDTQIADKFGPHVDFLVRLFKSINRPAVLENPDGTIADDVLVELRAIECANLYDQQELTLAAYPNLCEFAQTAFKEAS